MMHTLWRCLAAAGSLAMLGTTLGAQARAGAYRVTDKHVLEGPVRWDYLSVDSERHHLFLTRGDHVDVYDLGKREVVGSIPSTPGVHGVAVAADLGLGFSSNGAANAVTVFRMDTLAPQATVPVGAGPDSLVYDTATRRVFVANGKDNSVSVIDAATRKVVGTIALSGAPETAVVDGRGRLFVALEDRNAIAEIDTSKMKLVAEHRVAPVCEQPAGLTIDPHAGLLYAGCHNQKLVVVDARTGKLVGTASIGRGNDAVAIDLQRKLVFASNGDGTLTVVDATAPFAVRETVDTMPRARTVTLDPATHDLYLVSAEADPKATAASPQGRAVLKPGTFTVITVGAE
jgi:YVTN family beta-propeller protein